MDGINGDGLYHPYVSVYLSGCDKVPYCADCQNKEMQKEDGGFDVEYDDLIGEIDEKLNQLFKFRPKLSLCFVGGDPLTKRNRFITRSIAKHFKEKYGDKLLTIVYSWRMKDNILGSEELTSCIENIDIGVLGEFDKNQYVECTIPASKNQEIYDFKNKKKLKEIWT